MVGSSVNLFRDLVERALGSVWSKKIRDELQAVLAESESPYRCLIVI
jgi:hypothetical protein